jgi:hypothetical protein
LSNPRAGGERDLDRRQGLDQIQRGHHELQNGSSENNGAPEEGREIDLAPLEKGKRLHGGRAVLLVTRERTCKNTMKYFNCYLLFFY